MFLIFYLMSAIDKYTLIHIPKTGGTSICNRKCSNLKCDYFHRQESYWQQMFPDFKTMVILRNPVDRFVSAFNYAKFGTKDDLDNRSGHRRDLFLKFKNVSSFVTALQKKEKSAIQALRLREGGRQFEHAYKFLDGNPKKRILFCYGNNSYTKYLKSCVSENNIYWSTKIKTYLKDKKQIDFIKKKYDKDVALFTKFCDDT